MTIRDDDSDNNAVGAVDRSGKDYEKIIANLSTAALMSPDSGPTVGSGLLANGSVAAVITTRREQQKKEKADKELRSEAQRALKAQIEALDRQIDALNKQIDKLDREYEENLDRLTKIRGQQHAITNYLNGIDAGGKVELDENGHLKNKSAEQALEDYERRTGKKIDRNNPDAVVLALQDQERYDDQQGDGIEQRNHENRDEREHKVQERDSKKEERSDLERQQKKIVDGLASEDGRTATVTKTSQDELNFASTKLGADQARKVDSARGYDADKQDFLSDFATNAPNLGAEFSKASNSLEPPEKLEPVGPRSATAPRPG